MNRRLRLVAPLSLLVTVLAGCSSEYGDAAAVDGTTSTAPAAPAPADGTASTSLVNLTYSVGGLHCDGCVQGVTTTVAAIPGVADCQVSLEEGRMTVTVDDPATGEAVASAVRGMNYTVAPLPAGPTSEDAAVAGG